MIWCLRVQFKTEHSSTKIRLGRASYWFHPPDLRATIDCVVSNGFGWQRCYSNDKTTRKRRLQRIHWH